ncbi:hypothetical protein [Streptomyces sp. NPDC001020]
MIPSPHFPFEEKLHGNIYIVGLRWVLTVFILGFLILWWCIFAIMMIRQNYQGIRRHRRQVSNVLLARRYALVSQCAEVIHRCYGARRGGEQRADRIRGISKGLQTVRRGVLDAHSSRGTIPLLSNRRKRVKAHECQVCAALDELEGKLDTAPDEAFREIAEALLTIADRYCQGRVGDLLEAGQLSEVPRQRNWDALRYLAALTLAAVGIIGLGRSRILPEGADAYVFGIVLIAAFVVAFGRNFRRHIDVLGTITGP